jgi:hypothetical protein
MRTPTIPLVAVTLTLCHGACERPRPLTAPPPIVPAPEAAISSALNAADSGNPGRPPPSSAAHPGGTKPNAALVPIYAAEPDAERRRAIIADLLGGEPITGVAAVGELLKLEKRSELRVALFDALDSFDGQVPAKLALIRAELLEHRASGEAREAATDALLNIQDRAAIPLWKTLQEDADDSLHDVARQAITALEALK